LENGTPFDDLHLSTLVRPVMDVNGVENVPSGTFNAICQRKYADETLTTDEAVMLAILREASNNPNGTQFRVKVTISRNKTVRRLGRDGSQFISTLVEVNLG
jgi:hypothetical protein